MTYILNDLVVFFFEEGGGVTIKNSNYIFIQEYFIAAGNFSNSLEQKVNRMYLDIKNDEDC